MDNYLKVLQSKVSEKRYIHILGVYDMATEIATKYNLDIEKCQIAAILHDITKEDKNLNTLEFISTLTDDELILKSPNIWHSFTGAFFAQNELNINDADILDAIRYHTIAKEDLSDIGKAVFVSDVIEINRTNSDSIKLRNKFIGGDISFNDLVKGACEIKLRYGQKKNINLHPNLERMYDKLK